MADKITVIENDKDIENSLEVSERDNLGFARYLRTKDDYKEIYTFTLPGEEMNKKISTLICITREGGQTYVAFGLLVDGEWTSKRVPAQII